jgi:hypothetical protein
MVEFKNNQVALSAVDARVRGQIFVDELASRDLAEETCAGRLLAVRVASDSEVLRETLPAPMLAPVLGMAVEALDGQVPPAFPAGPHLA